MNSLKVKGLSDALRSLDSYKVDVLKKVESELQGTAMEIVADAKTNASSRGAVDKGNLVQSIAITKDAPFDKTIRSNANYSAYVEFGTGTLVDVPAGLEDYAKQFKGQGIRQVNLPARPFFIPAFRDNTKKILERLKKILDAK